MLAIGAALAEHPARIKKIFNNMESYPKNGAFKFTFFNGNTPANIVIDDRLPMKQSYNRVSPVNARVSANGAWWMPILEKAYLKFSVFYANIDGGTPMQGFRDFTGYPIQRYRSQSQSTSKMFSIMEEADKKDWSVTAACNRSVSGLVSGHAYTILNVYRGIKDSRGTSHDLLEMRNPWGREQYRGAFSDSSSSWTAAAKAKTGMKKANDGKFFLPVNIFK